MTVQLTWRQRYVFVDGYTFRHHPERLLRIRNCQPLPIGRAQQLFTRLAHEAPDVLERLRVAYALAHLQLGSPGVARELGKLLGPPAPSTFAPPGPFARLIVFERVLPKAPSSETKRKPPEPTPSLAEIAASVSLALVDEWGNPLPDVRYELVTPDGGQRSGAFDQSGGALQNGVQRGNCELSLPELGSCDVKPRAGPPDGWLRDEISILLREASGELMTGLRVNVVFANGETRSDTLGADGCCRLEQTPSWPLRVECANFDAESWD